jgi:hypothetical protein
MHCDELESVTKKQHLSVLFQQVEKKIKERPKAG